MSQPIFTIGAFLFLLVSCKETNEQLLDKGYQLSKQKKFEKAIETYDEVIRRNNKLQLAYYNRGSAYTKLGRYDKALFDFNTVMDLQISGQFNITFNPDLPYAGDEVRAQVPYNDALYQRAQVKYFMDSLLSSFSDFQSLVDKGYEEKSNCMLWQGMIYIKAGEPKEGCVYFEQAKECALTKDDREEADRMKETYCKRSIDKQ